MKKFGLVKLICAFAIILIASFLTPNFNFANAQVTNQLETKMFLPSSPLEFYNLNSPVAVSYSLDGYLIISEYQKNEETNEVYNRITIYNPLQKSYSVLPKHPTLTNITKITKYGDFIYYISQSEIYYIPLSNLQATPVKTGVIASNFFSFYGDLVLTNLNNMLKVYKLTISNDGPVFTENFSFETTAKSGFIADDGNIYFVENGAIKIFRAKDSTILTLTDFNYDVIDLVYLSSHVYFTTTDGLYKLKLEKDAVANKIISITSDATTLGYLKSPQGLTVKNGNVLVCDNALNSIQEVDFNSDKFTSFAITTESTAEFRLTNNASDMVISENYIYALDNASLSTTDSVKRIVKIAINNTENVYNKIDLSPIYEQNPEFEIKLFTASDNHLLLYNGEKVMLYKTSNDKPSKIELLTEYETASVTQLDYLDGAFYYTDTAKSANFEYDVVNLHKIQLPSEENELNTPTKSLLTENAPEIKGVAIDFSIDIFGNAYVIYKENQQDEKNKLIRLYNGTLSGTTEISHNVLSIQSDFAGNVYVLDSDNKIYKYDYNVSQFIKTEYQIATINGDKIKKIALNYRSEDCYYLGNACIYTSADKVLDIKSLSRVGAKNYNPTQVYSDVQFIQISKNAKLFKVKLGEYEEINGVKYFANITPISNPNTSKIYTVIADIDNDYYLVSYSPKLTALVRKTSVNTDLGINFDATIINPENYAEYSISVLDKQKQSRIISNQVSLYSRPIIDENYKVAYADKGETIYALKEIVFNGKSMTLVSLEENGEPIGYVLSGYLCEEIIPSLSPTTEGEEIIGGDSSKRITTAVMILLIAFTITASAIFIELKLLSSDK